MNICERVMAESDGRITDVCIHLYYKLFDIKLLTLKITIMKKRLLSALLFVSLSFFTVNAQDYWLNEDFSSQEWQDAIRAWIDETGVGTFPEATPSNIDIPDGTEINGFTLNGAYIRPGAAELEQTCSDGDTHQYGLRLRNKGDSYIQLPQIDNDKKISIHVRNGNGNNENCILLEEYDASSFTWNLLETIPVQRANDYTNQDEILEVNLDKTTPVTLRLFRGGNFFTAVYKITVEKNVGGTLVQSTSVNDINIYVDHARLYVMGDIDVAKILFFDVCGKVIFESVLNGSTVDLPSSVQSGTYIVKLVSPEISLTKKVCIQ